MRVQDRHDDAVEVLINEYCREAGVRNLKKQLEKIYRKVALNLVKVRLISCVGLFQIHPNQIFFSFTEWEDRSRERPSRSIAYSYRPSFSLSNRIRCGIYE